MFGAYAFSPYAVPVAITTLLILALGTRVLLRGLSRVTLTFFALTVVASIWLFAFTFLYCAADARTALFWAHAAYLGVPLIAPAIYHFTTSMLRIERRRRFAIAATWILGAAFSVSAVFTDLLVSRVTRYWWGFYPRYNVAFSIPFLAFFFGALIVSLAEFVRAYAGAVDDEKRRIRLFLVAFAVAYIGCVDYLPKYGIPAYPFGYLPILGFVFIVAVAMRHSDLVPITPSLASREIIATMVDMLFVCDSEGLIRFANRAACDLLGRDEREIVGRGIEAFLEQEGDLTSKLARRSIRNAEYVFVSTSGERIDSTLSIAPVMHEGHSAGAVIIGRDIRDRKRAEREVLQAVTLLQSTLESTADGILVIGEGGRILSYNQRFVEMWRIPQHVMESGDDRRAIGYVLDQLADPDEFLRTVDELNKQPEAESFDLLAFKDGRRVERY